MIGLMDCNNFFVSCERLFRPDLVGKPVAVLSANDGCIIARSQEVKDMADSLQKVMWLSPRPNYYKITDPLDCPTCGKKMYRGFFSYGLPVEIDRCPACDSIWFDRNELEILQHLIEKNRLLEIGRK